MILLGQKLKVVSHAGKATVKNKNIMNIGVEGEDPFWLDWEECGRMEKHSWLWKGKLEKDSYENEPHKKEFSADNVSEQVTLLSTVNVECVEAKKKKKRIT